MDNGFKPGYAKVLEGMMEERAPGYKIKGNLHIISCIKKMEQAWQVVYDMVYGMNMSRFRWDPERQCVVAKKAMWDEYIKVSNVGPFHVHWSRKSYLVLVETSFFIRSTRRPYRTETGVCPTSKTYVAYGQKIGQSAIGVNPH